ncbi:hyaluronidase-4 [Erinaceus europaeus]|uniref:Hyaluronidase n=1 Tax=Erinaceus europaeus TaxID=9365 RepID=A0ABM3XSB5_ERIEU|nr:hyaluronidase-4 [Erinaceus europaeus]
MCNWLTSWIGVLLSLFVPFHSTLKPAMPPVINRPFSIFWAAPTTQCQHLFNVTLNLRFFNIISNPWQTQSRTRVVILYPNELGFYPYFSEEGKSFNGGIPQKMNLHTHLRKTADDIAKIFPWWRSEDLVVIDWESWKPQWYRNWGNRIIYKNYSLDFTKSHHPDWSETKVETVAQQEFENAGKILMNTTLTLASEMRPKSLWGFYLYPDCYNYDYRINPQFYTGNCPNDEIILNDQLQWLWEKSTALYISIYLDKILKSSLNALKFVHFRIREAMRIAEVARHDYVLPVFIFSRPYYLHSIEGLSQQDLISTIGESAAMGAAGIVIWGDMNLTSSEGNCTKVQQFVNSDLGSYIVNVSRAAEACSLYLCRNNGRCIRKIWKAPDYLHLNPTSYHIVMSDDGEFNVQGKISNADLAMMMEKFSCHCYQGYEGADCRERKMTDDCDGFFSFSGSLITLCLSGLAGYQSIHL